MSGSANCCQKHLNGLMHVMVGRHQAIFIGSCCERITPVCSLSIGPQSRASKFQLRRALWAASIQIMLSELVSLFGEKTGACWRSSTAPIHGIPKTVYSNWAVATECARNGESDPEDSDGMSATELVSVKREAGLKSSTRDGTKLKSDKTRNTSKVTSPDPDSNSGSVDSTTICNDETNGGKTSAQRRKTVGTLLYWTHWSDWWYSTYSEVLVISDDSSDEGQVSTLGRNCTRTRKRNDSSKNNSSDEDLQVKHTKGIATGSDCMGISDPPYFSDSRFRASKPCEKCQQFTCFLERFGYLLWPWDVRLLLYYPHEWTVGDIRPGYWNCCISINRLTPACRSLWVSHSGKASTQSLGVVSRTNRYPQERFLSMHENSSLSWTLFYYFYMSIFFIHPTLLSNTFVLVTDWHCFKCDFQVNLLHSKIEPMKIARNWTYARHYCSAHK